MLSDLTRRLLHVTSFFCVLAGAALFLLPSWASGNFAWEVSPLVAMTIGAWLLGNAWLAFIAARRARWSQVLGAITYLGLFGLLQLCVVHSFGDKLILGNLLAWTYLAALVGCLVSGLSGLRDFWHEAPILNPDGRRARQYDIALALGFVLIVGTLGLIALTTPADSPRLGGQIFPETISLFTLRSFGAFYLALALGVVPLLFMPETGSTLSHTYAHYALALLLLAATLWFVGAFAVTEHPLQAIYAGAYLLAAALGALYLTEGTGSDVT